MTTVDTPPKRTPQVRSRRPRSPSAGDYSAVHAASPVANTAGDLAMLAPPPRSMGPMTNVVFEESRLMGLIHAPAAATVITYRRSRRLGDTDVPTLRTPPIPDNALPFTDSTPVLGEPVASEHSAQPVEKSGTPRPPHDSITATHTFVRQMSHRGGEANAEHIAAYTGVDHRTGQQMSNGLKKTANTNNTIAQKAGNAAEIIIVARGNAGLDLVDNPIRLASTNDTAGYGKNHSVVDVVATYQEKPLPEHGCQVKFVSDYKREINGTVRDNKGKGRYRDVELALPSEQVFSGREHCYKQARACQKKADRAQAEGRHDDAAALRLEADRFSAQAGKIVDSGVTRDEANYAAENPLRFTHLECLRSTNQASVAAVCGSMATTCLQSGLSNLSAVFNNEKEAREAAKHFTLDVGKAGGVTYATTFVSSLTKGILQQSNYKVLNTLGNANAPMHLISGMMTYGTTVYRYANREISGKDAIDGIAAKSTAIAFSTAGAAAFQLILPIPVLGAAVGSWAGNYVGAAAYQGIAKPQSEERIQMKILIYRALDALINPIRT